MSDQGSPIVFLDTETTGLAMIERDPDGELIKTLIDAAWDGVSSANPLSEDEVRHLVSLQLAAIRETHDIVPKGGGGQ